LGKAISATPNGGTIVLTAGTYPEGNLEVPAGRRLTIQAAPGEAVWLSGSDVITGWTTSGGDWVKDGFTPSFTSGELNPTLVNPEFPLAGDPDMTFIDGRQLTQVGSRAAVVPGTFFVDDPGNRLWIGENPSGRRVEAAVRSEAVTFKSSGSVMRGLGVRHYATAIARLGAVKARAQGITFENVVFQDNAAAGLSVLYATDARIRSCTAIGNGQLGVHAEGATGLLVEGSLFRGNNRERFSAIASSGGIKAANTDFFVLRRNLAEGNFAHGFWLDLSSDSGTIVRNVARNNTAAGIIVEMSTAEIIASNVSVGNHTGIIVSETSRADVYNNTVLDSQRSIYIVDGRREPLPVDIAVRNNVIGARTTGTQTPAFIADDVNGNRSASTMRVTSDRNRWYRRSTSTTPYLMTWGNYPSGKLLLRTLSDVQARTGQDRTSAITDNATSNPYVEHEASGKYGPPPGSSLHTAGVLLPQRVAAALGVTTTTKVPIGVLPG
jgi:parallel beta-helix repeat protein